MSNTPADILRKARIAHGFSSAREAAENFGWTESTYTSHENGTRGIRPENAKKYARAFKIPEASLLGISPGIEIQPLDQGVRVLGEVNARIWRDKDLDSEDRQDVQLLHIPEREGQPMRFAAKVGDKSADRYFQKDDYGIFVPIAADGKNDIRPGDLVLVETQRADLIEWTIRRVADLNNGLIRLVFHTNDNQFKEIVTIPASEKGVQRKLLGRVVGKYAEL